MSIVLSYYPGRDNLMSAPKDGIQLYSDHIYNQLTTIFPDKEIIYSHFEDFRKLRGKRGVSHLFGISANFDNLARTLRPETACLLSVNEHALMRRTIRDLRKRRGFSKDLDDPHDGYVSNLKETKYADFVLGIGNWSVFQSYVATGFPKSRLFVTGYPYWQLTKTHEFHQNSNTILMFPGYICTRKGADYVEDIVRYLNDNFSHFKLKLVGFLAYSKWKTVFRNLERKYPENFEFLEGRVDFGSSEWRALATNVAFAIFPTHEEGLAGCALDVINLGIPLVHSSKTGIEYQHKILPEVDFERDDWRQGLAKVLEGGRILWREIADHQKSASFHINPRYSPVGKCLARIANGRIWPNIDTSLFPEFANSLSFVDNPKLSYEYKIDFNLNPGIRYRYLSHEDDFQNQLLIATMLLEKYTSFDSINLENTAAENIGLFRSSKIQPHPIRNKTIELIVREYISASKWPGQKLGYLRVRESIITLFTVTIYRSKRIFTRFQQKLNLELNTFCNNFRK